MTTNIGGSLVGSGRQTLLFAKKHVAALVAVLVGTVIVGTGCSTTGVQAGSASYADPYLLVNDSMLASQVSVVSVEFDKVGGLSRGTATLRSNRDRTLALRYRFSWYDKDGRELDPRGQPYHPLLIEGRDAVTVSSVAPHPDAEEFKIRLQRVRNGKTEK